MPALGVEVLESPGGIGFDLDYDGLNLIPGMIAIASIVDGSERMELLDYISLVLDSFIEKIKSPSYVKALDVIEYPLVNVFELVEALGVEGLEEVLAYARSAIEGGVGKPPEVVEVYADLLGWSSSPNNLEPRTLGYAIILSLVASFNKTLNDIIAQTTSQG
ncbi:MAG: hypothetical protein ACO2OZ_03640 [Acidilobaceae archaeon]